MLIARAVAAMQAHHDWVVARITAGLEAADRGEFASDADMQAIFEKYGVER